MISVSARFTPRSAAGQFVPVVISPAVLAAVKATCEELQQTAQEYCPVDTGDLRDSITVEINDSGTTITGKVGPHMPYADYVEFGTGQRGAESAGAGPGPYRADWPGMPAQPYMRPALDETRPKVLEIFKGNISEVLS